MTSSKKVDQVARHCLNVSCGTVVRATSSLQVHWLFPLRKELDLHYFLVMNFTIQHRSHVSLSPKILILMWLQLYRVSKLKKEITMDTAGNEFSQKFWSVNYKKLTKSIYYKICLQWKNDRTVKSVFLEYFVDVEF